ncbi:MAG: type I-E CRISPR-associated protein Cas6/Cse3/CasE [Tissierellia bacterium]|nr:type I-E CRISPR-associated protein Cas6/Cse3/CasE [Tissierellia bacterium]
MYLSRVEIDYGNRKTAKELSHLGAFHNWVEQSFPKEFEKSIRTRKLWRVDDLNNKKYLLIVSQEKPDIGLLEKYGKKGSGQVKDYDIFLNSLKEGKKYRFKITLNTTKAVSEGHLNKRGRVYPITDEFEQLDFLLKRAKKNGFKLEENGFYLLNSDFDYLKKPNEKKLNLIKAVFQGELEITDKEKFIYALSNGIGKKKAYGFGMMTVIPV